MNMLVKNLIYHKNNTKKPSNFDLLNVINNLRHLESSGGLWKTSSLVLDILITILLAPAQSLICSNSSSKVQFVFLQWSLQFANWSSVLFSAARLL